MAPCLSKFPSLCLEAIFKHVPLSDLYYSVGLVCPSWYNSRRTELMRRHRLVLVAERQQQCLNHYCVDCSTYGTDSIERVRRDDGSPWHTLESLEQFSFDLLLVPGGLQTDPFFTSLITNFSNISRLTLIHYRCTNSILANMIRLLDHLSEHLVELKLKIQFRYIQNDDPVDLAHLGGSLLASVNRLQSLRHLNLALIGLVPFRSPALTCLSRLSTFGYCLCAGNRRLDNLIIASLMQYARDDISIDFTAVNLLDTIHLQDISLVSNQLAASFNSLSIRYDNRLDFDDLRQFCTRFNSLSKLHIDSGFIENVNTMPMTMLARCLTLLPQLVQFELRLCGIPPVEAEQPDNVEDEGEEAAVRALPPIAQVPSVRLIIWDIPMNSHRDIERLMIAEIFSNLQVVRLLNYFVDCQVCGLGNRFDEYDDTEPELARRIAECKPLARRLFVRCANLHTIELVDFNKKVLITADEL